MWSRGWVFVVRGGGWGGGCTHMHDTCISPPPFEVLGYSHPRSHRTVPHPYQRFSFRNAHIARDTGVAR